MEKFGGALGKAHFRFYCLCLAKVRRRHAPPINRRGGAMADIFTARRAVKMEAGGVEPPS